MNELFELTTRPNSDLFPPKNNSAEPRLGDLVLSHPDDYAKSDIVILGSVQSASEAISFDSDAVRREFYNLTNFGISRKIFDLGNLNASENHQSQADNFLKVVRQVLNDNKRLMVLSAENTVSYQCGLAMAEAFGKDLWLGINTDSHLDTSFSKQITETTFRRLLEEKVIIPQYFYSIAFQPYFCSPVFFRQLQRNGVKLVSLEQLRSRETADLELRELIRQEFIHHSRSMSIFFNYSMNAIRASDAPGVYDPSPFGLRAGEFLTLVQFAGKLVNTKMVQFTNFDSKSDIANRTAKLTAIAMHRFISSIVES